MAANLEFLDAGVDWLTVTTQAGFQAGLIEEKAIRKLRAEERLGNKCSPWAMQGYIGFTSGSVQVGTRADGTIVRIGADVAKASWREFFRLSDNCSRLDVQLTARVPGDVGQQIRKEYLRATRIRKQHLKGTQVTWLANSDSSSTLYLGSRASERFVRIYDKASESGLERFKGCVRYEIEYKGGLSRKMANWLSQQDDERASVIYLVNGIARDRLGYSRIVPTCPNMPMSLDIPPRTRMAPTLERSLKYIGTCIRASARRCIESGYQDDFLKACGLTIVDNQLQVDHSISNFEQTESEN